MVCDLTGVTGPVDAEAVDVLASVGSEVEHWPGSRVGMICPTPRCAASWPDSPTPVTSCSVSAGPRC